MTKPDIIQGWKNIAAYVDRDVSTVKRWERDRGLPVRRTPGTGRANVYAQTAELSRWLGYLEPETRTSGDVPCAPAPDRQTNLSLEAGVASSLLPTANKWYLAPLISIVLLAVVVCAGKYLRIRNARATSPAQARQGSGSVSPVPEVQELYLRGEYLYEQRTPDTMRLALQSFQQATARDPADAVAWAGLANAYLLMHEYGLLEMDEAYPMVKAAASQALALEPALSDPHVALGWADFFWLADVRAADREFSTAIRLAPDSATAHSWYGAMLTYEARFPEALAELEAAQRLQPQSTSVLANRAFALGMSGRRDEAVSLLQQVGYNDRNAAILHHLGLLSEIEPRNLPLFLEQFRHLSEFRHDNYSEYTYETAEIVFRHSGERAMWQTLLDRLLNVTPRPSTVTLDLPRYEAFLGKNELALDDLESMARAHKPALIGILIDPAFAGLHRDARFARLVAEVGLPPSPEATLLPSIIHSSV